MSSGVGGSRVSFPSYVQKTIQDIREITGRQHSDDEIYAVLKECSMDPNESAQKLLYLDTFHEVKSRRDRRKENLNGRGPDDSRLGTGLQRRGVRGGGQDVACGRNFGRRENGASNITERYSTSSSLQVPPKIKSVATSRMKKPIVIPNGFKDLSNGNYSHGYDLTSSLGSDGCLADVNKLGAEAPQSDGIATSHSFGSLGNKQGKCTSKADQLPTPASPPTVYSCAESGVAPSPSGCSACTSLTNDEQGSQQRAKPNLTGSITILSSVDMGLSNSVKATLVSANNMHNNKSTSKSKAYESKQLRENSQSPSSSTYDGDSSNVDEQSPQESLANSKEVVGIAVEAISQSLPQSNVFDGQHVTFPIHFQVPEALKNGLTFGSFDITFGLEMDSVNAGGDNNSPAQSSQDIGESLKELSSDKNTSTSGVYPDHTQCLPPAIEVSSSPEVNVPAGTDSEAEPPKLEIQLHQEGSQNRPGVNGPNYSIGVMSSLVGNQLVSLNGHEPQAHETHVPSLCKENSQALSAANPVLPAPSSITVSSHSVPFYRQTYPTNFFPYGQYISPVYMPPMHQFLYHNGFPAQPPTGNMFLSPAAAAAAGLKFSLPQFKPGTNAGNLTHIGLQSGSSFVTAPPVGCAPASAVSSGSSMGNEDIVASQLKESQIYSTGQQTEGSAVWIHAPGQDVSNLLVNPLYNLTQGHHVTFLPAQAGHGTFSGIYPPGHTITAPAIHLQQSQLMAGADETIGLPSGAYQQAQHAQVNWSNTAF